MPNSKQCQRQRVNFHTAHTLTDVITTLQNVFGIRPILFDDGLQWQTGLMGCCGFLQLASWSLVWSCDKRMRRQSMTSANHCGLLAWSGSYWCDTLCLCSHLTAFADSQKKVWSTWVTMNSKIFFSPQPSISKVQKAAVNILEAESWNTKKKKKNVGHNNTGHRWSTCHGALNCFFTQVMSNVLKTITARQRKWTHKSEAERPHGLGQCTMGVSCLSSRISVRNRLCSAITWSPFLLFHFYFFLIDRLDTAVWIAKSRKPPIVLGHICCPP